MSLEEAKQILNVNLMYGRRLTKDDVNRVLNMSSFVM